MVTKVVDIGGNQTVVDKNGISVRKVATYYGMSTDAKPIAQDADIFVEKDTMNTFIYDEDGGAWRSLTL